MSRGTHGEKIVALLGSDKLPTADKSRVMEAMQRYDEWIAALESTTAETLDGLIAALVDQLNEYKFYIDVDLIFDSTEDFLYRQKGQLKLDNTVMEEFLPIFVRKCIEHECGVCTVHISSHTPTFSSAHFASSLSSPAVGGGLILKAKDQNFSMSRKLYMKSSHDASFAPDKTITLETYLGYVLAELKTNLDKTMFQEASATAHDVKLAVAGAKYYLLCDFLDMTPISTITTDIDEILIVRKCRRISANVRKTFSTYSGRLQQRSWYLSFLKKHPYSPDVFKRFIEHILSQMRNEDLIEESVLDVGYF